MKITKIVDTRCQILRLKCNKFDFGWGCAPDPAGELTALLQTQLDLRGLLLREGRGMRREGRWKGGESRTSCSPIYSVLFHIFWASSHTSVITVIVVIPANMAVRNNSSMLPLGHPVPPV